MAVENKPLMPKATAVWLVDNTSLTFEQIADFCGLHPLEVKGIADEDVAKGIKGQDPVTSGQLSREQIVEAENNHKLRLKMAPPKYKMPVVKQKKAPRYTPVSKRQDKPDAVYWILRNHPEFTDADIIKLVGTTKATIQKIRERSHWNATNIKAVDPVTLGLCSQLELDLAVSRAALKRERAIKRAAKRGETLKPLDDAPGGAQPEAQTEEQTEAPVIAEDSNKPEDETSEP
ncbi:MAG TPA: cell cycle transcriptional regulator TrcR [Rhizomicrobium sp.]